MNENGKKKREWVKTAAIVFLSVMLVLTFFSNTIMNYSLPEVATQYVQSGTITAKIRGSGTVESGDPYNVEVKESRKVASVAVRVGQEVEKGEVLMYLEDEESEELKAAKEQLETLWADYRKSILSADSSTSLVNNVQSGNVLSPEAKLAKIDAYNKKIDNLESAIKNYNHRISEIDAELSKLGNDTVDTSGAQSEVNNARAEVEKAESAVTAAKDKLTAAQGVLESANSAIKDAKDYEAACKAAKDEAEKTCEALSYRQSVLSGKAEDSLTEDELQDLIRLKGDGEGSVNAAVKALNDAEEELGRAGKAVEEAEKNSAQNVASAQSVVNNAQTEYDNAVNNKQNCENRLADAQRNLANLQQAGNPNEGYRRELNNEKADLSLELSRVSEEKSQAEQDLQELLSDFAKEADLSDILDKIHKQQELVNDLTEKSIDATITAPISGTVTQLNVTAGKNTDPGMPVAVLQPEGKGYTLSFSVTNEQARRLSVGDVADLINAWRYDDVTVTLANIRPDPDDPGQKKRLTFDVTGNVTAGQTLNLSVGQKSANYDFIVPNSAIREDNNGKFILIVESKQGPLSTRYIASRVDVEVLASDDTQSAISAALYGYEFVITTSTKPVEAGKQVRLSSN